VRRPAAYFRGLVARGERGELRLERSVFGLLGKGSAGGTPEVTDGNAESGFGCDLSITRSNSGVTRTRLENLGAGRQE